MNPGWMASQRRARPRSDHWTRKVPVASWRVGGEPDATESVRARERADAAAAGVVARPTGKRSAPAMQPVPARVGTGSVQLSGPGRVVVRLTGDVTIGLGNVAPAWVAVLIREMAWPL
jgi:hypothetical protein